MSKIRRAARKQKLGVRELARQADLSPSMVSRVLSGERTPALPNALRLAKILDVRVEDFVRAQDVA